MSRRERYPVLLDVSGRLVIVVGSGRAVERTSASLASYGADVVVITSECPDSLVEMEAAGTLTLEQRGYVRGDLKDAFLVVCASGSPEIDAAVRDEARSAGVLVTVTSDADASDFTVPSVVRRGALQIAVSTGGIAPAVARSVRRDIASTYGPEWGVYVALLGAVRVRAIEQLELGDADLAPLFEAIAASDVLDRIRAGSDPTADEILTEFSGVLPGAEEETGEGS